MYGQRTQEGRVMKKNKEIDTSKVGKITTHDYDWYEGKIYQKTEHGKKSIIEVKKMKEIGDEGDYKVIYELNGQKSQCSLDKFRDMIGYSSKYVDITEEMKQLKYSQRSIDAIEKNKDLKYNYYNQTTESKDGRYFAKVTNVNDENNDENIVTVSIYVNPNKSSKTAGGTDGNLEQTLGSMFVRYYRLVDFDINKILNDEAVSKLDAIYEYGKGTEYTPEEIKAAIKLLVAHMFEHREASAEVEFKDITFGVKTLLGMNKVYNV